MGRAAGQRGRNHRRRVVIMDIRLTRLIRSNRVEALRGLLAQREQLEYTGDSSVIRRELAKAEAELQALGQEQPRGS